MLQAASRRPGSASRTASVGNQRIRSPNITGLHDTMPKQLPLFEIRLRKRGRACRWYLCTIVGHAVIWGSERSRAAANYRARRALFQMLLVSAYRPHWSGYPSGSTSRRTPFIS